MHDAPVLPAKLCPGCQVRPPSASARYGLCMTCCKDGAVRGRFKPADPVPAEACVHCSTGRVNRPRGLCWGCYYRPGVKELYPPTSKYAQRGVGNLTGERPLPAEPTDAEPGTDEKIAVMVERAKRGESLFHPEDVRLDSRPRGGPAGVVLGATMHLAEWHPPPDRIACGGAIGDETPGVFVVPSDPPKRRAS